MLNILSYSVENIDIVKIVLEHNIHILIEKFSRSFRQLCWWEKDQELLNTFTVNKTNKTCEDSIHILRLMCKCEVCIGKLVNN